MTGTLRWTDGPLKGLEAVYDGEARTWECADLGMESQLNAMYTLDRSPQPSIFPSVYRVVPWAAMELGAAHEIDTPLSPLPSDVVS